MWVNCNVSMPILLFKNTICTMCIAHTNLDSYYYVGIMSCRAIKWKLVL